MLCFLVIASGTAMAAGLPPSTWVALATLPGADHDPVFALAVNPANDQDVIAGNGAGGLYRSVDGGLSWKSIHSGAAGILTVAYSPFNPGLILAGTQGGGAFVSTDGGAHWTVAGGLEGRKVRAFAFAKSMIAAGTDRGVYVTDSGAAWTQSGLATTSIDAVSVAAVNPPVKLVAGGDGGQGVVPLYQSLDSGATWAPMNPAISGTIVVKLASGPLPRVGDVRPLVVGTNAGLVHLARQRQDLLGAERRRAAALDRLHADRIHIRAFRSLLRRQRRRRRRVGRRVVDGGLWPALQRPSTPAALGDGACGVER